MIPALTASVMRLFKLSYIVIFLQILSGPLAAADGYTAEVEKWRSQRLARLTAPDGWLTLIGLYWLKPGDNSLGSAADNDIVLSTAPAKLGTVTWMPDGKVSVKLQPDSSALIDGKAEVASVLTDDSDGKPSVISFGTSSVYLISRADRKGLRVKDSAAAARTGFLGLDYFPIDPAWRIEANWVPFDPPREIRITSIVGTTEKEKSPGKAVFDREGKTFELIPVQESPDSLFFIFSDGTSGKETYGAARFLYSDLPKDGKVVLDFNRAVNPPCAFTPFATCPLPPKENRLTVRVTAGEKNYRGESAH
jgi:uncharacterized protein